MKKTTAVLVTVLTLGALARAGAAREVEQVGGALLGHYGSIYEALVAGSTTGVVETAAKIAAEARSHAGQGDDEAIYDALAAAAERMSGDDLEQQREQFKALSVAMDEFLRRAGTRGWALYYCPMADGYWIQTAEGVRNPYFGASMLKCGDKVPGVRKSGS
jgi:hypothetical protein